MSNTNLTIAPVAELPASTRRLIESATKAIAGLEPSTARIVAAIKSVSKLAEIGMTVRGLAYYTGIKRPTAGRLIMAANASRALADYGDANNAIIGKVYTIACEGGAPAIKRLTDALADVTDGDAAYDVAVGILATVKDADAQAALTGPVGRAPQPPTGDDAPAEVEAAEAETEAPAPVGKNGTPGLMTYSTARLITELKRRIPAEWDAASLELFESLAVYVEQIVENLPAAASAE